MAHTPYRLHVGEADGKDISHPDPFWAEKGERVEFELETS